jgi:hypothetical protein
MARLEEAAAEEEAPQARGHGRGRGRPPLCGGALGARGRGACKTPDFRRKPESLYHRDSPWISGYRVQNVS